MRNKGGIREGRRFPAAWAAALLLPAAGMFGLRGAWAAEAAPKTLPPNVTCATQTCHADILRLKVLHGPAAENGCAACHTQNGNLHSFTPAAKGPDLCAMCHEPLAKKKVVHKPVGESCTNCHNPHGGDAKPFLVAEPPQLCAKCHAAVTDKFAKAESSHSFAMKGKACLTCHNPHTSDFADLLSGNPMDVCLGCHDKTIKDDGRVIPNVKEEIAKAKDVHAPLQGGDCSACHAAHASSNPALLAAAYPPHFYAKFTPDAYALCFQCHDSSLVTAAQTKDATAFRNGTKNLHTVHVVDDGKGRTCRACHAPHGSVDPHLIRQSVPFGPAQWPLPIGYKATNTGGSCAPGCHVPRAYDREKPVAE